MKIIFCLACMLWPLSLLAQHTHHAAHVHGLATLTLAVEGQTLEIQLESPAANIVGFEHKASSAQERQSVSQAQQQLQAASALFTFGGAQCQLITAEVDVSGVLEEDHHQHDHQHDYDEESHSEITAHYQFDCSKAQQLESIAIDLFRQFPGIEKIQAEWVTASQQGAITLTPNNTTIPL